MTKVNWRFPENIEEYVLSVLAKEADDIPEEKIKAGKWALDEIQLDLIKVNEDMIARHEQEVLHVARKQDFIKSINDNTPIYPLIVLGRDMFLVDGYARYRALKELSIKKVKIIKQLFNSTDQK